MFYCSAFFSIDFGVGVGVDVDGTVAAAACTSTCTVGARGGGAAAASPTSATKAIPRLFCEIVCCFGCVLLSNSKSSCFCMVCSKCSFCVVVSGSWSYMYSSFLFAYLTHFVAAIICFFAIHDSHDSHVLIAPCFVGRVEHWCSPSFAIPMTLFVVWLFLCLL